MVKHIETFPEQQLRKVKEEIEGYKPDRKFINGIEQPANQKVLRKSLAMENIQNNNYKKDWRCPGCNRQQDHKDPGRGKLCIICQQKRHK